MDPNTCVEKNPDTCDKYRDALNNFLIFVLTLLELKIARVEFNSAFYKGENPDNTIVKCACVNFDKNSDPFITFPGATSFGNLVDTLVNKKLNMYDFTIKVFEYFNGNIAFLGLCLNEEEKKICARFIENEDFKKKFLAIIEMLLIKLMK